MNQIPIINQDLIDESSEIIHAISDSLRILSFACSNKETQVELEEVERIAFMLSQKLENVFDTLSSIKLNDL